jgi:hypothetical protein
MSDHDTMAMCTRQVVALQAELAELRVLYADRDRDLAFEYKTRCEAEKEVERFRHQYELFEELAPPDIPRQDFVKICFNAWELIAQYGNPEELRGALEGFASEGNWLISWRKSPFSENDVLRAEWNGDSYTMPWLIARQALGIAAPSEPDLPRERASGQCSAQGGCYCEAGDE